ncbi:MAG: alanyl-tRNA synthetase [Chloroflexi bacterium]|nr:MAG: alanyl-tRNA synthetase [Chloroflexota bacterium]
MHKPKTGAEIRQSFNEFFISKGHTFVASSSLVPGGDATLLFTNAGMVQFKDVFLGTDNRPYTRAVNSQKCMRVAGKHNDLDDVGRDDSHHTFFEMLGNWSFGDYYKKEAIEWAWELLTKEWGVDPKLLYATVFKDDEGNLPTDEEAVHYWKAQPNMDATHVLYFGRKDNFWEMAETGPCGPCSEIHVDRGPASCDKQGETGHVCSVNGDCKRYLEIWNLVFIQYNRANETQFDLLPAKHVDTGLGLDRIVSILQNVNSNYRDDLFNPMIEKIRTLANKSVEEMDRDFTPYRVVADHARAVTFLIADGVVPGNTGRNYVCRMIIRRAARFGSKIGLNEPFLAKIAEVVIDEYSKAYPELEKNRKSILDNLTREEKRFERTVEAGLGYLDDLLAELRKSGGSILDGKKAFELYATHGLPFELTRDVAREVNLDVDQAGFKAAMEEHKVQSGAGKAFGLHVGGNVELYSEALQKAVQKKEIAASGVEYNPYEWLTVDSKVIRLFSESEAVASAETDANVEIIVSKTGFYIESGGQVGDTGWIQAADGSWEVEISEVKKPATGVIIHIGMVTRGKVTVEDKAIVVVDQPRRMDIMRNHTATHLLHAQLHKIIGEHARQAGSLVAPDRLRFDFTHHEAIASDKLDQIEAGVNQAILEDHALFIKVKPLKEAMSEGAMALFGEKYGENARTVTIDEKKPVSYELCGGTHVENTGDIGTFLILSESSVAAGVRRIEAVTGREAYEIISFKTKALRKSAKLLTSTINEVPEKITALMDAYEDLRHELTNVRQELIKTEFTRQLVTTKLIKKVPVLTCILKEADNDTLRQMTDAFREKYSSGVVALGSVVNEKPTIICAVTEDLVKRGLNAGDIVKKIAVVIDGSGGGRPILAQAGGKDASKLAEALDQVIPFIETRLV